ncbi:Integral membrane protein 2C CT-BRI3 [Triplophysa tibetana]|uniref:Integral membrane protein 2 n=1 Tax=Triplophysa tibetana TaxID=1572043 RepID=A0A5A9PDC1_9TELE|nr:Integral membrane protein 2C CT-BRI3 [Triplophysa tibetana]
MVKISFQQVSAEKPEKEKDGEKEEIHMPYSHDELVLPVNSKKSPMSGLWCIVVGLVIFMSGLIMASVCLYRYYYYNPQIPEDSLFHCRVMYEDPVYAPLLGRQEVEENVGIYLDDNYEHISVPVPDFASSDPADIIHDFHRGLTAYHDIALDKCYVIELNTTIVMPPRNLWELLVNVKRGMYLPQTYMVQEEMVVSGHVRNMRQLGPFIHRLCYGKETYRLRRRTGGRRIDKREARNCHTIRHFENTFVVETVICDRFLL